MFARTRSLATALAVVLLLYLGISTAVAAAPPEKPYVWPELTVSAGNKDEILPQIAYNRKHNEYLVVWHTTGTAAARTVRGARISAAGKLLAEFQIFGHPTKDGFQPAVAYDPPDDRYLVVFIVDSAGNGSNMDLFGRFIPWQGPSAQDASFPIITWPTHQWQPQVAYGRAVEQFLVVWSNEDQSGAIPMYISGKRIQAADGSFPGGAGSDATISSTSQNRVNPAVAYNLSRNEYLVVYDNGLDIFGTRYTGSLDHDFGGEFPIAGWPDAERQPDIAACAAADQYLVTWQSLQGGTNEAVYARFVSGDGAPGSVHPIDDTTGAEIEARIACDDEGTHYLVAWQTEYTNSKFGIWARYIWPDKQMSAAFLVRHPSNTAERTHPVLAGGRATFLAAWEHEREGGGFLDIYGRLLSPYAAFTPMVHG
jgi:hypothetical protein